jgi:hypothetical protein
MRHIVIALMLLMALAATAQTHYEGSISVGGKGGATFSRVNFTPTVQQTMSPGFTAGAMFRYIEEKNFGLIAELNLTQRGWKEQFDDADYNFSHRFTYLELPIMTHIFFGNNRIKGFFNLMTVQIEKADTRINSVHPAERHADYKSVTGLVKKQHRFSFTCNFLQLFERNFICIFYNIIFSHSSN